MSSDWRSNLDNLSIERALEALPEWTRDDTDHLCRTFKFDNFSKAIGFMMRAALEAERLDHHPEWSNVYGRVDVRLKTHKTKGISRLDLELAMSMDQIAQST